MAHARLDILEAATRAFSRPGLHGTTMQDIAREAGYTAASLYTYFKSKQEIVDAMSNQLTDEYIQVFEQPVPAVQCEACGYLYADDEERARALRTNREVEPPTRR